MKRNYKDGINDKAVFFTGYEVEKTPAFGLKTLFVTGVQEPVEIQKYCEQENCEHIFFGANHSYHPETNEEWGKWDNMIVAFLTTGKLCSLDIPIDVCDQFHDGPLCEYDNFIPQIRVPLPYTKLWNYNTMIKIDDVGFKATNPGVWCHSLHDLMDRDKFTDWSKYGLDKVIK
jgi:hypothetical protein